MNPADTCSRHLAFLRARVQDGCVRLSCYKSTPFFGVTSKEPADSVRLRVYRLHTPQFRFGRDYDEFFGGLDRADADLLFEGVIPAINNRKYEFVDEHVRPGETYAYWMGTDREEGATGPVAVRVRDPRVWWSWEEIERRLERLAEEHPETARLVQVGQTVHWRRLLALIAGSSQRTLLLIGGVHPGESGPELMLPAVEYLLEHRPELLTRVGIVALPSVCADERERLARGYPSYLRVNSNGVDLNRNFPASWDEVDYTYGLITDDPDSMTYRGPAPASEPETQAVIALCEQVAPVALLSFHHLASLTGSSFLVAKSAGQNEEYLQRCRAINAAYRAAMAPEDLTERPVLVSAGCTAGSLPAWCYARLRIPAFDLEGDCSPACQRSTLDLTTADDVALQQEQHRRGIEAVLELLAQGA